LAEVNEGGDTLEPLCLRVKGAADLLYVIRPQRRVSKFKGADLEATDARQPGKAALGEAESFSGDS